MQPCAKKRSSSANQPKKPQARKSNAGQKPKRPTPPTQKKAAPKKPNACAPKAKSKSVSFAEEHDFAQTCQRPDSTTYGTAGQCRKGTPTTAKQEPEKKPKSAPKPAAAAGGGSLQDAVGTAVEIEMIRALGGTMTPEMEDKLARNMEIAKSKNAETNVDVIKNGAKEGADDLKKYLETKGMTEVTEVHWTGPQKAGDMDRITGLKGLTPSNNQADFIVEGKDANGNKVFEGVSVKTQSSKNFTPAGAANLKSGSFKQDAAQLGLSKEGIKLATDIKDLRERTYPKGLSASGKKQWLRSLNKDEYDAVIRNNNAVISNYVTSMKTSMNKLSTEEMRARLGTKLGAPTGAGRALPSSKVTVFKGGTAKNPGRVLVEDAYSNKLINSVAKATAFKTEVQGGGQGVITYGKINGEWKKLITDRVRFSSGRPLEGSLRIDSSK
jgi:hypothetical protein